MTTDTTIDRTLNQISKIIIMESDHPGSLDGVLNDVRQLYAGNWPEYEACQVGYHTMQHALDVTLATARMAAGWNRLNRVTPLQDTFFNAGIISALFHDSGYIKDRGDNNGKGGKYSFNHIDRSIKIATFYLQKNNWPQEIIDLVKRIITITEFNKRPDLTPFRNVQEGIIARMMATADLMAQMADVDYMRRLHDLYDEFFEAYELIGRPQLERKGIRIYKNFEEMLDATISFYDSIILPRLDDLGRMDQYLVAFFNAGRNPYLENIIANLSGQMQSDQVKWQKLGEILEELGLVSPETIKEALARQQTRHTSLPPQKKQPFSLREKILNWVSLQRNSQQLGDILIEMDAVDSASLRQGILAQLLPGKLIANLSRNNLLFLLNISLLVQNSQSDPWIFNQILDMIIEEIGCHSCTLFLTDAEVQYLIPALQAGTAPPSRSQGLIPIDKGLTGWVIAHGRPAYLAKGMLIDHYAAQSEIPIIDDLQSILAIPIYVTGEQIGVLELNDKIDGDFTPIDADVMTSVGNIVAGLLLVISKSPEVFPQLDDVDAEYEDLDDL